MPLLHLTTRPAAWADWFKRADIPTANAFQGSIFENFAMVSKAATAGLGVALLPSYFAEEELKLGGLVALSRPQRSEKRYYLVIPETKVGTPHVQDFVKWVEKAKHYRPSRRVRR
jgi:LysR family glycine cleavage system transcriptional activator